MKRSLACAIALAMIVGACGGTSSSTTTSDDGAGSTSTTAANTDGSTTVGGSGCAAEVEFLTIQQDDAGWSAVLAHITDEFGETNPGTTYTNLYTPNDYYGKLQLVAAQDGLPFLYNAPSLDLQGELEARGEVLDLEPLLEELGIADEMTPAAASVIRNLYGGLYGLPFEFNIEGVWYNKQIFADHGLEAPQTWDDMVSIAETLHAEGIQPFAAAGIDGWPITRLISGYIFRSLGPDALQKVESGDAKLTDPEYVEAAQAVADLGAKGYFGPGVSDLDYALALDLFLQGQAAMYYMGSWTLGNFNNPEQNVIGADNIGFFRFPEVAGGAGSSDQTPMNAGHATFLNPKLLTDCNKEWLATVFRNYGDVALAEQGAVSGFTVHNPPADLPALTTLVSEEIASVDTSVTWFEQLLSTRATDLAMQNVVPLVTGQMSAEDYMAAVQEANE